MTTELATKPEYAKLTEEAKTLQIAAQSFQVTDDASRAEAADRLKKMSLRLTQVDALTFSPWNSIKTAYEETRDWRNGLVALFTGPKKTYAVKIGDLNSLVGSGQISNGIGPVGMSRCQHKREGPLEHWRCTFRNQSSFRVPVHRGFDHPSLLGGAAVVLRWCRCLSNAE